MNKERYLKNVGHHYERDSSERRGLVRRHQFWYLVGSTMPYGIIGYILGTIISALLVFEYLIIPLFGPFFKLLFGP